MNRGRSGTPASTGGGSGTGLTTAQAALLANQLAAPVLINANLTINGTNASAFHGGTFRCAAVSITLTQAALAAVPALSIGFFLPASGVVSFVSDGTILFQDGNSPAGSTNTCTRSFASNTGGVLLSATGAANLMNLGGAGGTGA